MSPRGTAAPNRASQAADWNRALSLVTVATLLFASAGCAAAEIESGVDVPTSSSTTSEPDASESASAETTTTANPASSLPVPGSTVAPVPAPSVPFVLVEPLTGWEAFDHYLDITIVPSGSQAFSVAVMREGIIEHTLSIGARTTAPEAVLDDPVTVRDRFRVASISKTITAITVLRLVEDGKVGLDDSVAPLLTSSIGSVVPAAGVANITVRDLLTHRSGFGQYEDLFFKHQVESCPEAAAVGWARPLASTPGTSFQYSNINFCLLGLVIEHVSGLPYEDAVHQLVLSPLGIGDMRLAGTFDVRSDEVEHVSEEGRNYMEVIGAAGAWVARPSELLAILNSIDLRTPGWKALDADTIAEMLTITVDPAPADPDPADPEPTEPGAEPVATSEPAEPAVPESGYGMGIMVFGADAFGHTGTVESAHAMMVRRPDGYSWAITVSGEYPTSTRHLARIVHNALMFGGFIDDAYVAPPAPIGL